MLVEADFALIGEWRIASDALTLDGRAPSDGDIYTFMLDGDVVHVCMAQNGLPTRMQQYRRRRPIWFF